MMRSTIEWASSRPRALLFRPLMVGVLLAMRPLLAGAPALAAAADPADHAAADPADHAAADPADHAAADPADHSAVETGSSGAADGTDHAAGTGSSGALERTDRGAAGTDSSPSEAAGGDGTPAFPPSTPLPSPPPDDPSEPAPQPPSDLGLLPIHFASGSAALEVDGEAILDAIAQILLSIHTAETIRIEGRSDGVERSPRGDSTEGRLELSRARAEGVRDYLVARGVPSARFVVVGLGDGAPLGALETDRDRERNRVVSFSVMRPGGRNRVREVSATRTVEAGRPGAGGAVASDPVSVAAGVGTGIAAGSAAAGAPTAAGVGPGVASGNAAPAGSAAAGDGTGVAAASTSTTSSGQAWGGSAVSAGVAASHGPGAAGAASPPVPSGAPGAAPAPSAPSGGRAAAAQTAPASPPSPASKPPPPGRLATAQELEAVPIQETPRGPAEVEDVRLGLRITRRDGPGSASRDPWRAQAFLQQELVELERLYRAGLRRERRLVGDTVLQIWMDGEGNVTAAAVHLPVPQSEFELTLINFLKGWHMPPPPGTGEMRVEMILTVSASFRPVLAPTR